MTQELENNVSRTERIRARLSEQGRLSISALAKELGVTPMTIRRDLSAMEKAGVLTRTHGGCVLHTPFVADLSFSEKMSAHQSEKLAIAQAAAQLLEPGTSVYLDTGTTALQVARALPVDRNLRVFTNNLRVAMELFGRGGVEVWVYGGQLAGRSPDLVGEMAAEAAGMYSVDVAVLGCDAIDAVTGDVYAADMAVAAISRQVQRCSGHCVFVSDHSKIGRRACAVVGRLGKDTTLVTDDGIAGGDLRKLRAKQGRIIVAKASRAERK